MALRRAVIACGIGRSLKQSVSKLAVTLPSVPTHITSQHIRTQNRVFADAAPAASPADTCFESAMEALQQAYTKSDADVADDYKKIESAIQLLKQAIEHDANHGPAHGQLGLTMLHSGNGDPTDAASHMQEALGKMSIEDEGRTLVQMGYGDALFMINLLEEAADIYTDIYDLPSTQPADLARITLRIFFVSLGLARPEPARDALMKLPENFSESLKGGLEHLESIENESKVSEQAAADFEMSKVEIRQTSIMAFKNTFRAF